MPIKLSAIVAATKTVAEAADKVYNNVENHFDKSVQRQEMRLEGEARRREVHLNGQAERYNSICKQKFDNYCQCADTILKAIDTVTNISTKISESVNTSQDIKSQIEERKSKIENERIKLDNDLQIELERIRTDYKKDTENADKTHEEEMERIRFLHQEEMERIKNVSNFTNQTFDILKTLAATDPHNPIIQSGLIELRSATFSLNESIKYLEG